MDALRPGGAQVRGGASRRRKPGPHSAARFPPGALEGHSPRAGDGVWTSGAPGLRVVANHRVEASPSGAVATLSLELQGLFGNIFGRMTKEITERYLAMEAEGLKQRAEDPGFTVATSG
jgi:hypothetical protein